MNQNEAGEDRGAKGGQAKPGGESDLWKGEFLGVVALKKAKSLQGRIRLCRQTRI